MDLDHITGGSFHAFMVCQYEQCGEVVSLVGDYVSEHTLVGRDNRDNPIVDEDFQLYIKSVTPAPHIIPVSENLTEVPKNHLIKSFELFWPDSDSCANRIRVFLESLLTQLGVTKSGRLADRIDRYEVANPGNKVLFDALRHVGNTASHEGNVDREALVDCYAILEHILSELIDKKSANVLALAHQLAISKGKASP